MLQKSLDPKKDSMVQCCDCDQYYHIHDTRQISMAGMQMNLYLCNNCLKDLPKIDGNILKTV